MPWWAIVLCCFGFGLWTVFAGMIGASIVMSAHNKYDIREDARRERENRWPPKDLEDLDHG